MGAGSPRDARLLAPAALWLRLHGANDAPVPVLVLRLGELERIAWRDGRPAARRVERRAARAFASAAARVLRSDDLLAHGAESDVFVGALAARSRDGDGSIVPGDCRAALARLCAGVESAVGHGVESGWTFIDRTREVRTFDETVTEALERGARERERFDFFSTVGHELRTPLTSIRGYLETLIEGGLDPSTGLRFLEIAQAETLRLSRLVEGMFDISLLDARALAHACERCETRATLTAAVAAVQPLALRRGVRLAFVGSNRAYAAFNADRLMQVAINVLENAIKHGRVDGTVEVRSATARDGIDIWIDDDGPGVPAQEREAIFGFLRRGRTHATGSGIGLAVARMILERSGGSICAGASPLGGASFRIRIPSGSSARYRRLAE